MATKRMGFKDVALKALLEGLDSVREAHANLPNGISRDVLESASEYLANNDKPDEATALSALCVELHGERTEGTTGKRTPLRVGMSKTYKVQQVKGADCFLRLPVDVLNLVKEEKAMVEATEVDGERVLIVRAAPKGNATMIRRAAPEVPQPVSEEGEAATA